MDRVRFEFRGVSRALVGLAVAIATAGCGGSDSAGTPAPTPTPAGDTLAATRVELFWEARSRGTLTTFAPSTAQSAEITLRDGAGRTTQARVNRKATPQGYAEVVSLPTPVAPGESVLSARFFSGDEGKGDIVADASETVIVPKGGGSLPGITTVSRIASVRVLPGQSLMAFVSSPIAYSLHDATGKIVAVPTGALFWELIGSDAIVQESATTFLGKKVGAAKVRLRVDGKSSDPVEVRVTSETQITATPSTLTLTPGESKALSATVTKTNGGATSVSWRVLESGGGQVSASGVYTAPTKRGVFHVEAISDFDTEKRAQVEVKVQSGSITGVVE